jgi:hypothetical protein
MRKYKKGEKVMKKSEGSIYDKNTINELEVMVESKTKESRNAEKEQIEILFYLKTSGRYKENKRYERATFYDYIEDRFNIRRGTYDKNQLAYLKFPDASAEYGVGLVSKVITMCSAKHTPKVLGIIEDARKSAKRELNRAKIQSIIENNRILPKIEKKVTDWKTMYEREAKAHESTKRELKKAIERIKELTDQNEKLKVSVGRYSDIQEIFEKKFKQALATG